MADGTEKNDGVVRTDKEEIYSKAVCAGKRTYFFDVKTTRRNDYYLTLLGCLVESRNTDPV